MGCARQLGSKTTADILFPRSDIGKEMAKELPALTLLFARP
jgi:hypothetical protein